MKEQQEEGEGAGEKGKAGKPEEKRRFKESVKQLRAKEQILTNTYDSIEKQQSNMEKELKGQNE